MGLAKRMMEEYYGRGYGSSEKKICHECTEDYALQLFIRKRGSRTQCHYCHKDRKCVELEELMEAIMPGILFEYEDANECMGWDSEDGYTGSTYMNLEVVEELQDELGIDNSEILEDIAAIILDTTWCKRDPYGMSEIEEAYGIWERFKQLVKTKVRYVFYKIDTDESEAISNKPSEILEKIAKYVTRADFVRILNPSRTKIYRGRTHDDAQRLVDVSEFGPASPEKASANRMSPEGIPMFYGALDKETALTEIYSNTHECATVAEFRLLRPLRLIDLPERAVPRCQAFFDEEQREKRPCITFLKQFSSDLSSREAVKNSIEYVPTQIVTEYFRHIFKDESGESVDGIMYDSAQRPGGKCVVLFIAKENCVDKEEVTGKGILCMEAKKVLRFKKVYSFADESKK